MPKLDLDSIPETSRTGYPEPYAAPMASRRYRRLAPAAGIVDFGASHVILDPGGISSQRHWHEGEDEMVVMLDGEAWLIEDEGETLLRPGDIAVFLKNVPDGHHLVNRSERACTFVAIGRMAESVCHYPDIDLTLDAAGHYTHKDGTPY